MHETEVAAAIRTAGNQPRKDQNAKKILKHRSILARILKAVDPAFANLSYAEIEANIEPDSILLDAEVAPHLPKQIEGTDTESVVPGEGTLYFDVLFKAKLPDDQKTSNAYMMYFDVEAQGILNPQKYPLHKRAVYYTSRMLGRQITSLADPAAYNQLQKVCSIWVCFDDKASPVHKGSITEVKYTQKVIEGNYKIDSDLVDLARIVYVVLDDEDTGNELLDFLAVLFNPGLTKETRLAKLNGSFGVEVTTDIKEEVCDMDGIYQAHQDYGFAQGEAAGYAKKEAEAAAVSDLESKELYLSGVSLEIIARVKRMTIAELKGNLRKQGVEIPD